MPLQAEDIQVGKTYRAKRPTQYLFGGFNDRTVIWMGANGMVQYDGPAVKIGAKYPSVTMEKFLKWASYEVIEEDKQDE